MIRVFVLFSVLLFLSPVLKAEEPKRDLPQPSHATVCVKEDSDLLSEGIAFLKLLFDEAQSGKERLPCMKGDDAPLLDEALVPRSILVPVQHAIPPNTDMERACTKELTCVRAFFKFGGGIFMVGDHDDANARTFSEHRARILVLQKHIPILESDPLWEVVAHEYQEALFSLRKLSEEPKAKPKARPPVSKKRRG